MRRHLLVLMAIFSPMIALVAFSLADDPKKGRRVALLVAVQDYTGTVLSNLKYSENDIHELAKVLTSQGYKPEDIVILTRTNAFKKEKESFFPTAENIRKELRGLVEDLREEDTFLVAFSGHGIHLKQLKERGLHFCPKGTDLDKPESMISLTEVYEQLEKHCKASVKLLVVDACRNDPSDGKGDADSRVESLTRPVIPEPPGGTVAFFSCSTGQKSYESDNLKHGIFFYHFIQGLKGGLPNDPVARKGEVTIPLLEDFLTRAVPLAVKKDKDDRSIRQIPERKGSLRGQAVLATVPMSFTKDDRGGSDTGGEALLGEHEETYEYDFQGQKRIGKCRMIAVDLGKGQKMELVRINAGYFIMGASNSELAWDNSKPQHRVQITKDFYIGKYVVTQGQYRAVMGNNPSHFDADDRLPVENVSWDDAKAFCKTLQRILRTNVDLPTEAQWEYAGRAGTTTSYHSGNEGLADWANFDIKQTLKVGKHPANPWGLYDMQGNVWQWCADWYEEKYYYNSPLGDPQGPNSGEKRVMRCGSTFDRSRMIPIAKRSKNLPTSRGDFIGFRVVIPLER